MDNDDLVSNTRLTNGDTVHIRNNFASKKTFLISQLSLLTFFLLAIAAHLYPEFHPDLVDGLRGFLIAIAVGTLATSAWKNRRRE